MESMRYRDLKNTTPTILRKKLTNEGELLLTVNDKPIALMISLFYEDMQDIALLVSRLRSQIAVRSIRHQAHKEGLNKMTLRDVNALIKRTRVERKA